MTGLTKGVAVALLHILIVTSLGGKVLYDRVHRPRVWVRTGISLDSHLEIHAMHWGRYLTLRLAVQAPWFHPAPKSDEHDEVWLEMKGGWLVAHKSESYTGLSISSWTWHPNGDTVYLDQSVAFFLAEHVEYPRPRPGEELWAEVTMPKKGPPRPIQLALKQGTEWKPLTYR
jgi:hypothetical protein